MKMIDRYCIRSILKKYESIIFFICIVLSPLNCFASEEGNLGFDAVVKDKWVALNTKKIFFGHHSVGYNILDGVSKIINDRKDIDLNIVKLESPDDLSREEQGYLSHGKVGENFDPKSKINDFVKWMDGSIGENVDIAFMKFCFVDIGSQTEINTLFEDYKKTYEYLTEKYPKVKIVHLTVPLVSEKTGLSKYKHQLKGVIKSIINKNEFYENKQKFLFNQMIRNEYKSKSPIFDIAAIESTYPDGHRSTFKYDDRNIESMVSEYTDDGGHLSPMGKEVVGKAFLAFLANFE